MRSRAAFLALCLLAGAMPAVAQTDSPFVEDGTNPEGADGRAERPQARPKPERIRVEVTAALCRRLVRHTPEPGVAYEPGVDVRGDPVAPADIDGGGRDVAERLLDRAIVFDLMLNPLLFAGNPALADRFPNTDIDLGRIEYDRESGRLTHDGEPLADPQTAAMRKACRDRLESEATSQGD